MAEDKVEIYFDQERVYQADYAFDAILGSPGISLKGHAEVDNFRVDLLAAGTTTGWADTIIRWPLDDDVRVSHAVFTSLENGFVVDQNWIYEPHRTLSLAPGFYLAQLAPPGGTYTQSIIEVLPTDLQVEVREGRLAQLNWPAAEGVELYHLEFRSAETGQLVASTTSTANEYATRLPAGNYLASVSAGNAGVRASEFVILENTRDGYSYEAPGQATVFWRPSPEPAPYYISIFDLDGRKIQGFWTNDTIASISLPPAAYRATFAPSGGVSRSIQLQLSEFSSLDFTPLAPLGRTKSNATTFSWFPVPGAVAYYFQLADGAGDHQTSFWSYGTTARVEDLNGNYQWRVIPLNNKNEQAQNTSWVSFSVENELSRENILGTEPDQVIARKDAKLNYPEAAVVAEDGTIYIADTLSHVIRRERAGMVDIYAGTLQQGYNGDGLRTEVQLNRPVHLTLDGEDNLWVLEQGNRLIRKIDRLSGEITTMAGIANSPDKLPLPADQALVSTTPLGETSTMEFDSQGRLWLPLHSRLENGDFQSALYSINFLDTPATLSLEEEYDYPVLDISLTATHTDLLFDRTPEPMLLWRERIDQTIVQRELISSFGGGIVFVPETQQTYVGDHTEVAVLNWELERSVFAGGFANVPSLTHSEAGLLIVDGDRGVVHTFDFAGDAIKSLQIGGAREQVDSIVRQATYDNDRIVLLENKRGLVLLHDLRTDAVEIFAGNGISEVARLGAFKFETGFSYPVGIAVDDQQNVYVAENNRILKIDQSGLVSLFAGAETPGYAGDGGPASEALFRSIRDIRFDGSGNLLVADTYNQVIRKITPSGTITSIAGDGKIGSPVYDVPATETSLNHPHAILPLDDGSLLIADSWNNAVVRLKTDGSLAPFAGRNNPSGYQGGGGFGGDRGLALDAWLNTPIGLDIDDNGSVYIADVFNHRIRSVAASGVIDTFWGGSEQGYRRDGSLLNFPLDILIRETSLIVTDTGNGLVSRFSIAAPSE
ncbi:hypothetical protein SH139x_001154 [Planctomycetaceae bacterium SH139]